MDEIVDEIDYTTRFKVDNFELLADEFDSEDLDKKYAAANEYIQDIYDIPKNTFTDKVREKRKENHEFDNLINNEIYSLEVSGWYYTGLKDNTLTWSKGDCSVTLVGIDPLEWCLNTRVKGFNDVSKAFEYAEKHALNTEEADILVKCSEEMTNVRDFQPKQYQRTKVDKNR